MNQYRWASLTIASALRLPELKGAEADGADWTFDCVRVSRRRPRPPRRHHWSLPGCAPWLAISRLRGGAHLLRFTSYADFIVDADRRLITCEAVHRTTTATIRHLLLDQVLPALVTDDSRLGLHASAVVVRRAAVAFLGQTGRGKSTLTALFGTSGDRVLTDDCLVLRRTRRAVLALPSYPSLRIWNDSAAFMRLANGHRVSQYSPKLRLDGRTTSRLRFAGAPAPLARLYVIGRARPGAPSIDPLSPRDACIELVRHTFHLDPRDQPALRRQIDHVIAVARDVPVRRLHFAASLDALADVRRLVLEDLRP